MHSTPTKLVRAWFLRLGDLVFKQQRDLELTAEIESHLEMHIADRMRSGLSAEEARREAVIELGGVEQTHENYRDCRGFPLLDAIIQDVRFGLRTLRRNPGFTTVTVLTLALAIGANSALFSVAATVFLGSLPYPNPNDLVEVGSTYPGLPQVGLSGADFHDWSAQARELAEMGAYRSVGQGFNVGGLVEPQRLEATYVTSNLFSILRVKPLVGRFFSSSEDEPGGAPAVILSYRAWQSYFGSDSHTVGRLLTFDGRGYTVVGVLPSEFTLANWAELWLPAGQMDIDELTGRVHHPFAVIARLRPGASITEFQTKLSTLAHQAEASFPVTNRNFGVTVHRLDRSTPKIREAFVELFAAVVVVLLIACANIANLLLVRNTARQKELSIRTSLGASRTRIARQLLTETVLLFGLGGALALVLATAGLSSIRNLIPPDFTSAREARLSGSVLLFTLIVCTVSGSLCGLGPALVSLKTDLNPVLKGRRARVFNVHEIQRFLVISEVALALTLMIGAGLVIRSFRELIEVYPGFQSEDLLTMQVSEASTNSAELRGMSPDQLRQLSQKKALQFEQLTEYIQTLPGVDRVGGIDVLPLASSMSQSSRFLVEGQPVPTAAARPFGEIRTISLGYFAAMGIPLLKGRLFTSRDWGLPRIVINEAMSERFWPQSNPVGQRINLCSLARKPCWYPIVGVVGNVHQFGLDAPPTFDIYSTGGWTPYLTICTSSNPLSVAAAAIEGIHRIDPSLPVTRVMTADKLLSDSFSPRRFSMLVLVGFAALALSMAVAGIYGLVNYIVLRTTHDIGLRVALGAERKDVLYFVLLDSVKLVVAGVAIGIAGALALTQLMREFLYDVSPTDPLTFVGVAVLLISVALLACYVPARKAMRVDPAVALRYE